MLGVQILQNKAMQLLFFDEYQQQGVHTHDLYIRHKILPVSKLAEYAAVMSVFRLKNGLSHSKIQLKANAEIHHHATRQQHHLHLPQPHNHWGKDTIAYRGALAFNSLPPSLRSITSLPAFKYGLKSHYLNYY